MKTAFMAFANHKNTLTILALVSVLLSVIEPLTARPYKIEEPLNRKPSLQEVEALIKGLGQSESTTEPAAALIDIACGFYLTACGAASVGCQLACGDDNQVLDTHCYNQCMRDAPTIDIHTCNICWRRRGVQGVPEDR